LALAAQEWGFEPQASFVIGDKACDIELGQRVGAITILVRTGYGAQLAAEHTISPDYVANDVADAAQILEHVLQGERMVVDAAGE
jgi:D-glycero-D-manno-heptose 1,7-bisphosphate phosphatase